MPIYYHVVDTTGGKRMIEFQLFRVKVLRPRQMLLEGRRDSPEILRQAITSRPSSEFRAGTTWHIGNIEYLHDAALYFRFGKTTQTTMQVYDEQEGFEEQEFEAAPYTHVILDTDLEVCAIAKKSKLARTATTIANRLVRLLGTVEVPDEYQADFEISPLNDPQTFLRYLEAAYRITKFWMRFSRPNPIDVHRDYVKPMEDLLENTGARTGKTEMKGEDLTPGICEELSRSAAATGDNAGATIEETEASAPVKKQLKTNPVLLSVEEPTTPDEKQALLQRVREQYRSIRHGETDG